MDPNILFANCETIKRSMDEASKAQVEAEAAKASAAEKRTQAKAKEPQAEDEALRTSRALGKRQMESCMFEWQV